jgi:sirohydrochlorin cobaltochelatase
MNSARKFLGLFVSNLVLLGLVAAHAIAADGDTDHSGHSGHNMQAVPDMLADGRRVNENAPRHEMSDAQLAGLRKKVALYRALTDREARMNMAMMSPNYEWYVSDLGMQGDVGVIVLSHGVGKNSDQIFVDSLVPMAERWPTAVSFGMAMMMSTHLQSTVDDLKARGASTVVLVPTSVTENNTLTRQWEYIFGMREESSYLDVDRIKSDQKFLMTKHFDDHPLITEALIDYTNAQSQDPANEVVILVGHGPEDIEDNALDLEILRNHVDRIQSATDYSDVRVINLQDDAYPPIRKSNVKKLRRWITSAQRAGKTVIITVVATASFGVQEHIREDLRGLDYKFAEKGLSEHPNYQKWILAAVEERLVADAKDNES